MIIINRIWSIGLVLFALLSCAKDDENSAGEPKFEKGYVTGKAFDTKGNPIAGAYLYLQNTLFHNSYVNSTTSADGTYKIPLSPGAWKVIASFQKEYNGQTYTLRLHTDNSETFSEEGAVRNATWKLEGRNPDPSYNNAVFYGGQVDVSYHHTFDYEVQEKVELTFTPSGPLIDGSEGKTYKLKRGDHYWPESTDRIEDLPIGRYMVKAVVKSEQGDVALLIGSSHTADDFTPEFQLDFIPDNSSNLNPVNHAQIVITHWIH